MSIGDQTKNELRLNKDPGSEINPWKAVGNCAIQCLNIPSIIESISS